MQLAILQAREFVTRTNIQSFRKLVLENIDLIHSNLNPLEQELLVNDLFLPLDLKDLNKLLQIIIKFKNMEFLRILLEFYSMEWISNQRVLEDDWEEWVNLIYSVNYRFSIQNSQKIFQEFFRVLSTKNGLQLEKIIAKATRVGDLNPFFEILQGYAKVEDIYPLLLKLTMFEQESFLSKLLEFMASTETQHSRESETFYRNCDIFYKLSGLQGEHDHSLLMILKNRFFKKFHDYTSNHLLIHSLSANQDFLLKFAQSLIKNWGNQSLVSSNSIKSCIGYTQLLLLVLEHMQDPFLPNLKLDIISGT